MNNGDEIKFQNKYQQLKNGLVQITSSNKPSTYIFVDREDFFKLTTFINIKFIKRSGRMLAVGVTHNGNVIPLHRFLVNAKENEEVLFINSDTSDLRLINLLIVHKCSGNRFDKERERLARHIRPIPNILQDNSNDVIEHQNQTFYELNWLTSRFTNEVSIKANDEYFHLNNLSVNNENELLRLISHLRNL
jgi:hypothetical protein